MTLRCGKFLKDTNSTAHKRKEAWWGEVRKRTPLSEPLGGRPVWSTRQVPGQPEPGIETEQSKAPSVRPSVRAGRTDHTPGTSTTGLH